MKALFAHHALLADGWRKNVLLQWDDRGNFTAVQADAVAAPGIPSARLVMPGMVNLHSHAFQRALGGLTEVAGDAQDSFWTWRDLMYRFARYITPEQMEAIAAQLYSECLRHGYTSMCEFHYVQRAPDGSMYPQASETAQRVIAAARQAGIGITMLPVLYSWAGFGEQPLKPEQARFRTDARDVLKIIGELEPLRDAQVEVGVAPHRCAPPRWRRSAKCWTTCRRRAQCTSISPSSRARCSSRWTTRASARCSTWSTTWRSTRAGAWCTPPT